MGKTLEIARDRSFDKTKTILPTEMAQGIYLQNAPSLQALKLMHLMIGIAGGKMADDIRHEVRLSEIKSIKGMRNHTRTSLTPLFQELAGVVITYDDPKKKIVTIGGLLDEAQIDYGNESSGDLLISWTFSRTFCRMAAESNHWAIIDRQTVFHLNSKYSVLLFQHIASLAHLNWINEKTFTIPQLRAMLSISAGKLSRFSNLKALALIPTIAEINKLSRLTLTAKLNKTGRTVTSVTITWQLKETPSPVKSHSTDQKSPKIITSFPDEGGIDFNEYWKTIKRETRCNMDNTMIAEKFRSFCQERKIALSSKNIDQIFKNFCRTIGEV
ncbi:MAG: Protein involved in initiation of plasmid replication [Candidatus Tokpelaia sp. JSC188]|nr:MAG: Protein involved in initiation of plasmid replication [Candidatus Tokpelaia sp. JSC188]